MAQFVNPEVIWPYWVAFAGLTWLVYATGGRLTYYGDVLGEKWDLGRSFIGLILLSTVTSLPELGTSLFSIVLVDSPDLALGNVLGSNLFNVFIIALMAFFTWKAFLNDVLPRHATTGLLVLFLYGLVGLALSSDMFGWSTVKFANVGIFTGSIFVVYLYGLYIVFEKSGSSEADAPSMKEANLYSSLEESRATVVFTVCALIVVAAGAGLAFVGKVLAVETGLGETFFGSLFFAFVTSLPEFVVSLAALQQLYAVNMAVGNVVGSCLFNLGIIFIYELAAVNYAVFSRSSPSHLVSVMAGILMLSLLSFAVLYRQDQKADSPICLETVGITVIYIAAMYFLYQF